MSTTAPQVSTAAQVAAYAAELAAGTQRHLVGITGPPGAGKSTLGQDIVKQIGTNARLVGMDGFHLSQRQLIEQGRIDRKGAIDTFDSAGFVALVVRLAEPDSQTVYAPEFRRDIEEPIAGSIAIEPDVRLIIIEGNYLLVEDQPWGQIRRLCTEVWYCERDDDERIADLIARHSAHGKSLAEAERWARGPDQQNAELIRHTRARADRIVLLDSSA